MSKISTSLIFCACLGISSAALAGWQDDCKSIDSAGSGQGACSAIQSAMGGLSSYAPPKPFEDTTLYPGSLSSQFPNGTPQWGGSGGGSSGGGTSGVLSSEPQDSGGSTTDSSGTFQ